MCSRAREHHRDLLPQRPKPEFRRGKGRRGAQCGTLTQSKGSVVLVLCFHIPGLCSEQPCRAWRRGQVGLAFHPPATQRAADLLQGWVCPEWCRLDNSCKGTVYTVVVLSVSISLDSFFGQFPPTPFVRREPLPQTVLPSARGLLGAGPVTGREESRACSWLGTLASGAHCLDFSFLSTGWLASKARKCPCQKASSDCICLLKLPADL